MASTHRYDRPSSSPGKRALRRTRTETVPEPPPKPITSGVSSSVITLRWATPRNLGPDDGLGYRIEICENNSEVWTEKVAHTKSAATSRAISGLQEGCIYQFRVSAIKNGVSSHPSPPSDAVKTKMRGMPSGMPVPGVERPSTAPMPHVGRGPPQINGEGGHDEGLVRRRYFFRGSNSENPFNCHYDVVTLDMEARAAQYRNPWVPVARIDPDIDVETLYFQDHRLHGNAFAIQSNLHTIVPQGKYDMASLMAWVATVRPRSQEDALPLFVLQQNILRSLLEEKIRASRSQADKKEINALRIAEEELRHELAEFNERAAAERAVALSSVEKKLQAALDEAGRLRAEMAGLQTRRKQDTEGLENTLKELRKQVSELESAGKEKDTLLANQHDAQVTAVKLVDDEKNAALKQLKECEAANHKLKEQKESLESQILNLKDQIKQLQAAPAAAPGGGGTDALETGVKDARQKLQEAKALVQTMRQKIAELKTYKVEPNCVQALHAAFVMTGTKEEDVADWNACRQKLNDDFFQALSSFDEKGPSKTALKHVHKLLKGIDDEAIAHSSEALVSIHSWVKAALGLIEGLEKLKAAKTPEPAAPTPPPVTVSEATPPAAPTPEAAVAPTPEVQASAETPVSIDDGTSVASKGADQALPIVTQGYIPEHRKRAPWCVKEHPEAQAYTPEQLRGVLVEVLEMQVMLDSAARAKQLPPPTFQKLLEDWLLHKHRNRSEATRALGGVVRGIREHPTDSVAVLFGLLSGVLSTMQRPYSAQCGSIVLRVLMHLRHIQPSESWVHGSLSQDAGDVHEALKLLGDPTSKVDISFANAAYQQATAAENFCHTVGERIEDLERSVFGATEGPAGLDQLLEFSAQLYWNEDVGANALLKEAFQAIGRPIDGAPAGVRQVLLDEFKEQVGKLWTQSGKEEVMSDCDVADLYWKCCGDDGEGEMRQDQFAEVLKAYGLHRKVAVS